jgi:hypothetical protein
VPEDGRANRRDRVMKLPSWFVYCDNTTAVNAMAFDLGPLTVWFSYRTPVAFQKGHADRVVRRNEWGPTTGKHLNAIDGGNKADRVDGDTFGRLLNEALRGSE